MEKGGDLVSSSTSVHYLNPSPSQRVPWLLRELPAPDEIKLFGRLSRRNRDRECCRGSLDRIDEASTRVNKHDSAPS